jgi:hypothetical protein
MITYWLIGFQLYMRVDSNLVAPNGCVTNAPSFDSTMTRLSNDP